MESPPNDSSLSRRRLLGIRGQLLVAFGGVFAILLASYFFAIATDEHFVQISEQLAVDQINAAVHRPDLILHTGDLTHLAKAGEFDTLGEILQSLRQKQVFYVLGEHDIAGDGKPFGSSRPLPSSLRIGTVSSCSKVMT